MVKCLAFDCQHYRESKKCKFYPLPIDSTVRKAWLNLLRLKHVANKRYAVCSCHFKNGSRLNLPEYFLRNINKRFDCFPEIEFHKRSRCGGTKRAVSKPKETSNLAKIRDLLVRVDEKPITLLNRISKKRASPRIAYNVLGPVIDLDLSDLAPTVEVVVPKSLTTCGINTCAHSSENSRCEWIKIPQVAKLRNQWIQQIGKFGVNLRPNSLICTCHFEANNDRIRGPTIFYANIDCSYNGGKCNERQKRNGPMIEQELCTETVEVPDFGESTPHEQSIIDDRETTLILMLNSTPAQITAALNLDTNQKLYNFQTTCRICLNDAPSRNIYEDHIENINIVDMLRQVTCSQISETDKLPKLVCTNCVQQIFYAYKFLTKFVNANKILVEYVNFCEAHVKTITDLKHSIHSDHCYGSLLNRVSKSESIFDHSDLSDDEILETDPLALDSPKSEHNFKDEPAPKYLPVIPAGFVNCYPEDSNISDIPSISADFSSYMSNCDVDESDNNINTKILVRSGLETADTSSNIEIKSVLETGDTSSKIEIKSVLETADTNSNIEIDVTPGQSLLKVALNDENIPELDNEEIDIKEPIISAEVSQTVESFKTVLKDTSDIDDHMKVDIIDTLIELYSLKTPDYDSIFDGKKILNCKRCNKIFAGPKERKKHNCANPILRNVKIVYTNPILRDQIESFQCRICCQKFSNLTILVSHSCFVKFTRKRAPPSEKPFSKQFTCCECSKKFDFYSELMKHREDTSHSDRGVLTDTPVEIDVSITDLNEINEAIRSIDPGNQVATVEQPIAEKLKHLCTKCDQRFEFFSQLVQHNRGCKPPALLTCSVCSVEMKRAKLTEHMKMHNSERTYCCEICGRSFKFGRHFKRHMEIHVGNKPYDCGECGRKFRQKSALKTHSLIHSGEKPYMCEGCGQKFRQRGTLTFHLKTKSCGKHLKLNAAKSNYDCSVCHKQLISKSQLIVHLKSHSKLKMDSH